MGHQRWRFGQYDFLSRLFRFAAGFHQVEDRRHAFVEETIACGGGDFGFVCSKLVVDEHVDTIADETFRQTDHWVDVQCSVENHKI